ncbi:hypothetical protein B5E77_04950 [Lachnoclostridium sp. An131]|nr:hypothetical protein B5E82_15130 [Lachnoclostridium sp. An138]OUQ27708.1 hypothetical protein B5E77_04950 [Lachnoclostridium sp. An131]
MWESCTLAFPCSVNRVIHDGIACYAHFHNAFLLVLLFDSFVRNSVVLAVYLLFSISCFFTVHEHWCWAQNSRKPLNRGFMTKASAPMPSSTGRWMPWTTSWWTSSTGRKKPPE